MKNRPRVGIGVVIVNKEGKVLIGKRKGSHAPFYSIPGGHLEEGETFEEAAIKEIREETSLEIRDLKVFCISNNLETWQNEGKHYISVCLITHDFAGTPKVNEPEKCDGWYWVDPEELPQPHFDASEMAIQCYLDDKFYIKAVKK